MNGIKENWSKQGSGGINEVRKRILRKSSSVPESVYGYIVAVRGEESYSENFKGIQIKMIFEKGSLENLSDVWFPLDISIEEFVYQYSDIQSFNTRINSPMKLFAKLTYKPPNIYSGKVSITSDLNSIYDTNHKSDSNSIASIINGLKGEAPTIRKTIKAYSDNRYNTGITLSTNEIRIASDPKNFLTINENGIGISANSVSFQSLPEGLKFAGIFSLQNIFLGLIPSTPVTPISQYKLNLPTAGLADMASMTAILTSIIGT